MRRLLVAGLAALAVLGVSLISAGTAYAADSAACTSARAALAAAEAASPQVPATIHAAQRAVYQACSGHDGGGGVGGHGGWPGNGGYGDHGGFGGHWHPGAPWVGPQVYGHQLWINANLGLDVCGYSDYNGFLSRNAQHRDDILRLLGASPMQRWAALHQDCTSQLAVVPNGLSLVNGDLLNLSLLGLNDAGTVNVCDYPDYNVFNDRFGRRFGNRWDSVRNHFGTRGFDVYRQLRVNARCTIVTVPSSTTIVQDPNTTYNAEAPTTAPSADAGASSPAPVASAPLPANAPAKAPNEGGWDLAYVLVHAAV